MVYDVEIGNGNCPWICLWKYYEILMSANRVGGFTFVGYNVYIYIYIHTCDIIVYNYIYAYV